MAKKCDWQNCKAWAKKGTAFCRHHPPGEAAKPMDGQTLLEEVVWDALENSRCPAKHRYQGPGKSLPCRWCRAAHAITQVLIKVEAGEIKPLEAIAQFEKQLGWTMANSPTPSIREKTDQGCSVCRRPPGEAKNDWCHGCRV